MVKSMEKRSVRQHQLERLVSLRSRIDQVDEDLVNLMAIRQRWATEALSVKEALGVPLVDLAREAAVVRRASSLARELGLDPEAARDVFWRLIGLSRAHHSAGGRGFSRGGGAKEGPTSEVGRR